MAKGDQSLMGGRGTTPLTEHQKVAVQTAFYFFDRTANVKFDGGRTRFREIHDDADTNHEILFGPDIYPGVAVANPNSCLSMRAAVVHELSHKARHDDGVEINDPALVHIDEALTSLTAIERFQRKLEDFEILQLVSDAVHRLQLFVGEHYTEDTPSD